MTTINQELYEALIAAGAPDDMAKRAAATVYDKDQIATKADLSELEHRVTAKLYQALLIQTFAITGIFAALAKLL